MLVHSPSAHLPCSFQRRSSAEFQPKLNICVPVRVLEPGAGTASGDQAIGGGECKTFARLEQYSSGLVGQGIRLSGVSNCAKLAEYIFVCQRTDV